VIEPPSFRLQQRLTALKLCRRADLRRCRRRVRQLARDLPAFDSVWIDALLQERKLTPFQARLLESPWPERLSVGPWVLVDQLGSGPHGETFLARAGEGKQRCVLKRVESRESRVESRARCTSQSTLNSQLLTLNSLVSRAAGELHSHVVTPDKVIEHDGRLVVLSRFVAGTPLTELLIRRGRFPADVVREIGRQLTAGLAFLASRGIVHGEIALWNVRLSSRGIASLVDAGIAPVVRPEVIIDAEAPPERFDGVAPERVATGAPATAASEIYALGCLLWQLLAGRPPFPTGDPLTKLAHHQTREVADVREWVPECPDALAELLLAMTAFDAADRPESFAKLADLWQPPTRAGRRRLRRFHASFRAAVPRLRLRPAGSGLLKRTITAAMALAAAAVGVGLLDRDFRGPLLSIAAPVTERIAALTGTEDDGDAATGIAANGAPTTAKPQAVELPAADPSGVILLESSKIYAWTKPIRSDRPIVIRGAAEKPAVVIVGNETAIVSAPGVTLENVRFIARVKLQRSAMLTARSDRFEMKGCGIHAEQSQAAVDWKAITPGRRTELALQDSVLAGGAVAVRLGSAPSTIRCENVLHLGPGVLWRFGELPPAGNAVNVSLVNLTQRNAGALLRVDLPPGNGPFGRVAVTAKNCVFHYAGENSALCVFGTSFPGQAPKGTVQFSGEGSLFPPGGRIAVEAAVGPAPPARVENEAVQIDGGLLACDFEFAGPAGSDPATSVIAKHRAPVRSQHTPGIDARRLVSIRP
jgi:eukaryotic-like serine/threonine-protein kinase